MKKTLLLITSVLIITSAVFAQSNARISIDKLSITITNLEIDSDYESISTFNWKANLIVSGFEIHHFDDDFQQLSHQLNNDDKIVINQFKASVSLIDNELKITNARFSSPFLKADIKAELLIDIDNPEDTWIKSSTVKLDALSAALERFVLEIEKELGQTLPRKGKSIVIEANGSLDDLNIKGMDLEKLMSPYYRSSAYASEARSVIGNIENASKMYYQTYGEWPSDVEELERRGQLEVDRSTKLKWSFTLSLSDDGGHIVAESTEEMKGGPGKIVLYDRSRGRYIGYGSPE